MIPLSSFTGQRSIWLHIVFSTIVLLLLYVCIHLYWGLLSNSLLITWLSCFFFLACVYAGRWLFQKWYLQHKPYQFAGYSFAMLLCIIILLPLFVKYIFHLKGDIIEYAVGIVPFYIIAMVSGILIKATKAAVQKQVQDAKAIAEQNKTELKLLQSQLSPHFLFNTLNNLYGISIAQHERMPDLLLKLSELLRYSVYETKQPLVSLQEELRYITNYIDFEKIRIGERLCIDITIDPGNGHTVTIAPMLLIVFVENAFKHSKNSLGQKIYIAISLTVKEGTLLFSVKNSFSLNDQKNNKFAKDGGIGLANVKKRLALLYPHDHELQQREENGIYIIELRLKVKNQND